MPSKQLSEISGPDPALAKAKAIVKYLDAGGSMGITSAPHPCMASEPHRVLPSLLYALGR